MRERVTARVAHYTFPVCTARVSAFLYLTLCLRFDDVAVSESACRCAIMTDKYEIDARYRYWRRHILRPSGWVMRCFTSRGKVLTPPTRNPC